MEYQMTKSPHRLHYLEQLPCEILSTSPGELGRILPGPSIVYIEGERTPPLFVSVLLHGNEVTGFLAIQQLLRQADMKLPRSILLFIGNIRAAEADVRALDDEEDFNRIWNGGKGEQARMAAEVLRAVAARKPLACIDIHNNTGTNPHYACINTTQAATVNLAARFSDTIVYFTEPHEVISIACSRIAPSVTLECGISGESSGTEHALQYLVQCLEADETTLFSPPGKAHHDVFHTVGRITVPDHAELAFGTECIDADICFRSDFDLLNFTRVASGTMLGTLRSYESCPKVLDNGGNDVTKTYLDVVDDEIRTTRHFIPAMFTLDKRVIHQDCLGYVMEPYPLKT
ncbi:M14 family metallopeptidase [Prosthecochloris sp. HL-130-GSB]|uniref:M14 family metallopeptidase n=1 Tax=Prosthecochloris sp. HL-130-GSB TaxID=1974213 RepID=UPI001E297D2C|nr:M14 family metallopeptidase [Prosthecochloris sp. HL-130-GSB]